MTIIIYTTKTCPYCIMAKNLLANKNITYKEINIDNDYKKFDKLIKLTKQKTVPQIFINNKFIGGYNDLKTFFCTVKNNT